MPVLATYGGKGSERVGEGPGMREVTELTRTLLQHAREILLDGTSSPELARQRPRQDQLGPARVFGMLLLYALTVGT